MTSLSLQARDRFGFCLFLAIALHLAVILGIGFSVDKNTANNRSIEVTLAVANDDRAPERAQFIAATDQMGSGTQIHAEEMTTTARSEFHAPTEHTAQQHTATKATPDAASRRTVTTSIQAPDVAHTPSPTMQEASPTAPAARFDREQMIREIASLEARIAAEKQALANRPRTRTLNTVAARSAAEAAYLNMWREKCERIGRANYPPGGLQGEVLMLVSILSDGSLEAVRILKSSGHQQLDQAALNTVRQASPYQPFNVEMRKSYDRLEFTRTWQFTKTGFGST